MQSHEKSNEPALSAERMASLDNSGAPRADVEDRIVSALHGTGVLQNERAAFSLQRSAMPARRALWIAGLGAVAATVMFFAGMKVGERRSNAPASGALASNVAAVDPGATTCPAITVAALAAPSQLIWY